MLAAVEALIGRELETRNERDIVTMLYNGKSYSKIARYLNLNANTIKSAMNRLVKNSPHSSSYATMLAFIKEYKAKEEAETKRNNKK